MTERDESRMENQYPPPSGVFGTGLWQHARDPSHYSPSTGSYSVTTGGSRWLSRDNTRAHVFQRRIESSFSGGRIASAFSYHSIASRNALYAMVLLPIATRRSSSWPCRSDAMPV